MGGKALGLDWHIQYMTLGVYGAVLYHICAEYNEIYYIWRGTSILREALRMLVSWSLAFGLMIITLFLISEIDSYPRLLLMDWFFIAFVGVTLIHATRRHFLRAIRKRGINIKRVGIVGCTTVGKRLSDAFSAMPWIGYRVYGFYEDRAGEGKRRMAGLPTIGNLEDLYRDAREGRIDVVYITLPMKSEARILSICDHLADSTASVFFVPDLFAFNLLHARWNTIHGIPVVSVYETPFDTFNNTIKRLEDVAFSFVILALILMPMAFIAIGVKLSSPGPVIYRQKRYGIAGDVFDVYKFRTMYVQDDRGEILQAQKNDPRVTRFGYFLRKYSLDELPQFINVIQGRMSIVGPRPHAVSHNEYYRKRIPGYMLRHKVRPGITGLAQIMGFRGETETLEKMEQRIRLDLDYIRHWSLWLDLKIIASTAVMVFRTNLGY